jgi:histidine triad (HIT) family protein
MSSIFTRILAGEIPCHKIWEDERHFAFLDIRPIRRGHTLVVPKREVGYLFDMPPEEQTALWSAVREVEALLRAELGFPRAVLMVIGWEVPHVHVHVIPTDALGDVKMPPPIQSTPEELAALARRIAGD